MAKKAKTLSGPLAPSSDQPSQRPNAKTALKMPPVADVYRNDIDKYTEFIQSRSDRNVRNKESFRQITDHMSWVYGRNTRLFCVDIEAWERNTNIVTEIGVSIYDPAEQQRALTPVIHTYHVIISEHKNKRNGRYVADHMHNFSEGTSVLLPMGEAKSLLQGLIDRYFGERAGGFSTFVGHDLQNDIDYLSKIGISIPQKILKLDTQKLFACSHGKSGASLQNALRTVKQPFAFLHNAGNDAYYTVMLALKLCDPHARLLLGLDLLDEGEQVGDVKVYEKIPANSSIPKYKDPRAILAELADWGVVEDSGVLT